jgi:hypothetical protein
MVAACSDFRLECSTPPYGHLVRQRMLERVDELRKEAPLVEELCLQ